MPDIPESDPLPPTPRVCGTGLDGGVVVPPTDPEGVMTISATRSFGGVTVRWTMPGKNAHAVAHCLLYRGGSSNFAASSNIGAVSGSSFYDQIETAGTFYYWLRSVSINGTIGELVGPASVTLTKTLPGTLEEELTGRIGSGVLSTALRAELNNLSLINDRLSEEIFDREGGDTSFAQALRDVQNGVAEAHTFITTEINSRVTANSAIAERIDLVASTAGSDVAAVTIKMQTWVGDPLAAAGLPSIGALYTAQVTVNGLIGGFGIFNDGREIEAGFECDRFWIGRAGIDKVLPFIVDGGTVYINKARIKNADIDTLKIGGRSATSVDAANGVNSASVTVFLSGVAGEVYDIILIASAQQSQVGNFDAYDNGNFLTRGVGSGLTALNGKITGQANTTHTYSISADFGVQCSLTVFVSKR